MWITTKYPGICADCGAGVPAGTKADWDCETQRIWCQRCHQPEATGAIKVNYTHEERVEIARRVQERLETEQPKWYRELKQAEAERLMVERAAKAGWKPVWQRNARSYGGEQG